MRCIGGDFIIFWGTILINNFALFIMEYIILKSDHIFWEGTFNIFGGLSF